MNTARPATQATKPWVHRHWLLTLVLVLSVTVLLTLGLVAMLGYAFMSGLKDSPPYLHTLQRARAHPEVVAALGQPIEAAPVILGAVEQSQDSGEANMFIFVHGPNGKADLQVEATYAQGRWDYQLMQATIEKTRRKIDLLEQAAQADE